MNPRTLLSIAYLTFFCALSLVDPIEAQSDTDVLLALQQIGEYINSDFKPSGNYYKQFESTVPLGPKCDNELQIFCRTPNNQNFFRIYLSDPKSYRILQNTGKIRIIIHGWRSPHQPWMYAMANTWINADFNQSTACTVSYERIAFFNYTIAATVGIDYVANCLANELLIPLIEKGLHSSEISIAGHSLGAQTAGLIGYKMKMVGCLIGLIEALGPAGLMFVDNTNRWNLKRRVDRTDARRVNIYHGCDLPFPVEQMFIDSGTADIYIQGAACPNRCLESNKNVTDLGTQILNSHTESIRFFIESYLNPNRNCRYYDGIAKKRIGYHQPTFYGPVHVFYEGNVCDNNIPF